MLIALYIISAVCIIILPIVLGIFLVRKYKLSWRLLRAGAITFVLSQVLHIPFLYGMTAAFQSGILPAVPSASTLIFNSILLGLLAGIFEETARYILFKFFLKSAHLWEEAVVVGAGHGGIEAIFVALVVFATLVQMIAFQSNDLSSLPNLSADQLEALRQQVTAFWSSPLYTPLLSFLERVFAICLHLSLSVMVLFSLVAKKPIWFWMALLWHGFVDAVSVYFAQQLSPLATELLIGVMAALSLVILFNLRRRFPSAERWP